MPEVHPSEGEEITKDPHSVHVFISYSHDDLAIASCLQDELEAINPDRVRCFLDAYSIRSGARWDSTIIANLKIADWLSGTAIWEHLLTTLVEAMLAFLIGTFFGIAFGLDPRAQN